MIHADLLRPALQVRKLISRHLARDKPKQTRSISAEEEVLLSPGLTLNEEFARNLPVINELFSRIATSPQRRLFNLWRVITNPWAALVFRRK
ncbi:hypothetical protein CDAR_252101 [Caerostris darwini]|uniref:Uncharacterized protein n=1 Tax=Caerostris darwini TaxID=1538125 RepID=A0AAV4N7Y3_9ARAC|nr:hypothetical protein CDAR_252101 [Caerostris darwini]